MNSGPATILIVDDEIPNRKLLEALLRPEGYLTVTAASGEEALAAIAQHAPDLVLLDVMMPGMDGYEVSRRLKASPVTSSIPIIMVTAQIERSARLAGLNAGAEEFLTKPVDRAELWLRVRNMLRLKVLGDLLRENSSILEREVQARTAELQRFRSAMDATVDAIMLVNRTTMRFVEVNATACTMLGYTREELLELGPAQLGDAVPGQLERTYDDIIAGSVAPAVSETHLRRKGGSALLVEVHWHAQPFGADWIIVGVVHDITKRKEAEQRLHHLAHYDALTGLPNRTLFHQTLRKTLSQASEKGWLVAVMFIDLDNFKNVNDMLGHAAGDQLLVQVSDRLVRCIRIRDTVGRLGGDEFAVIVVMDGQEGPASVASRKYIDPISPLDQWSREAAVPTGTGITVHHGAVRVAEKILEAMRVPFDLKGHEMPVTPSIGITIHPDDSSDPEVLMRYADAAMYSAKKAGRDTFRFYTAQMNAEVVARLDLEEALRKAIENREFVLHYQPKVQLGSGRISGLEALLRWQRPGHGLVPPNDFIPLLEETGLILRVGSWVIATACRQIAEWKRSSIGPMQVSVNVSGRQFIEGDLTGDIVKALRDNDVAPELLELELTESSLMKNTERTVASMQDLKKLGVHISIDDFGTGYSSLAYLRRFPVNKLKIDMAFVRDITNNPDAAAIALAIIRMAHSLKLEVIAEGVETAAQLAYLRRQRCDLIQGYYFSRPLPVPELEQILREGKCLPVSDVQSGAALRTLLLVDDDAGVLADLQRLLAYDGYHILAALSAAEGLELLALHSVQVVLCDQCMPVMSGSAFLARVKDLYPDTLRIVLSEHTDLESIMDAINHGAIHRFYTKSWEGQVLRDNIRDAFHHIGLLDDGAHLQGTEGRFPRDRHEGSAPGAPKKRAPAPLPATS